MKRSKSRLPSQGSATDFQGSQGVGLALSEALKSAIMPGRLGRYLACILVVVLVVVVYTSAAFG
jgi:hypothetical protein